MAAPHTAANAKNHHHPTPGRIYALDCKTVGTTAGRALARFTLLQATEYLVQSQSEKCHVHRGVGYSGPTGTPKFTDYLTQWSGVSSQSLQQGPIVTLSHAGSYHRARPLRQVPVDTLYMGHGTWVWSVMEERGAALFLTCYAALRVP